MPGPNPNTESIFWGALALDSPEERAAYLQRACRGDEALRAQVEELLAADPKVQSFLESPPLEAQLPRSQAPATPEGSVDQPPARQDPAGAQVGALIAGRYKLLEEIGEGGMGTVWVAEQTQPVRRKVALKLTKAGMDSK